MKAQANQIRPGWVIEHNGKQWSVLKIQILQPGKGGAFIQVEMRDVDSGNKTNERWRTQETVEKLMVEERKCQYLFDDGDNLNFMENDTFEQFGLSKETIGDDADFLTDGMELEVSYISGKPVGIILPQNVIHEVVETEPVVKGQTAASSNKPAILDNEVRVMVPPFVEAGDRIVVNTQERTYVERAKK